MYEHIRQPLLPRRHYYRRLAVHAGIAASVIAVSLATGVVGYRVTEGFSWLDSLLNASMILGGMGPVDTLRTAGGKWFASFYALFSGVIFLVTVGILIAPAVHRLLHGMHLEAKQEGPKT
jgi:hypothetical protein